MRKTPFKPSSKAGKITHFTTIFIIIIVILFGCSKEVNLNILQNEVKIGIKSLFTSDSLIKIRIEQSVSPTDEFRPPISNAIIFLIENKNYFDTLENIEGFYISHKTATVDKNYSVEIHVPGFKELTANNLIPGKILIQKAVNRDSIGLDEDGSYLSEARIEFDDDLITTDYYEVKIEKQTLNEFNEVISSGRAFYRELGKEPILTNEGLLIFYPETLIFTDALFNGQTCDLTVNYICSVYYDDNSILQTKVTLNHISEEYYKYVQSLTLYSYSLDNTIWGGAEPINVYSNIENGFGIFAAYNSVTITCRETR